MTDRHPYGRFGGVFAGLVIAVTIGCSSGPKVTGNEPIKVETSQFGVTLENRAGTRISDIRVELVPYGGATTYSATHYGLQSGERHDFMVPAFRAKDGMPLDLRVARLKSVRVTATDFDGKPVEVEVPWR